jgi:anti-sigma factor RsiW
MARLATLRASDAEREHVAERLRHATAEGRLLPDELDERLGRALTARTLGELQALVADLPTPGPAHLRSIGPRSLGVPALVFAVLVAMLVVLLLAALAFLLTSVFLAWGLWVVLGWWFFGHRRRIGPGRRTYGARL